MILDYIKELKIRNLRTKEQPTFKFLKRENIMMSFQMMKTEIKTLTVKEVTDFLETRIKDQEVQCKETKFTLKLVQLGKNEYIIYYYLLNYIYIRNVNPIFKQTNIGRYYCF